MKAEDKPTYVQESKKLFDSLDIEKLIVEPNNLDEIKKINRLMAIFTIFSFDTGQKLDYLFKDFQKWARASTRTGHIRNRAIDMMQYIDKTIQDMDLYEIRQEDKDLNKMDKFDVALSFAGEQRPYVERVALFLERDGGLKVFYDTNEEIEMWGNNLVDYLKNVFEKRANYCVIFISKEYAEKTWPNFERQIIQARALIDDGYLLPVRFDNTPLKGDIPTTKYIEIKQLPPEQLGEMIAKKVIGSDKYKPKKEPSVITLSSNSQISTTEEIPLLYIKPSLGGTGGPNGHFLSFSVKNMTRQVLLDIEWGIRGFGYEWKDEGLLELEPNQEKELTFPLSNEKPFTEFVPELNIFAEYKDLGGQNYFVRRELEQELVPSGGFYSFKAASFHSPTILKDDGLKFLSGPTSSGDVYNTYFSIPTPEGEKNIKISISRTLLSIWGFNDINQIKQASLELGHRKIRRMIQENNLEDYLFTTYDREETDKSGYVGYIRLRDSI